MRWWLIVGLLAACGRIGFAPRGDALTTNDGIGARLDNAAFITSVTYTGNLDGVGGADALCQKHANDAGIGGTFVALLSDADILLAGSRGWIDVTGAEIVDRPSDWMSLHMMRPLWRDELGTPREVLVWGPSTQLTCAGWTSEDPGLSGIANVSESVMTNSASLPCSLPAAIACVERGHSRQLPTATVSGRLAFVTASPWGPGGGIAAADAMCMSEASAAQLPGTFRALLATETNPDPFSRFSITGPPWVSVDGIPLAATATALADPTQPYLDAFLTLTAAGNPTIGGVWVGSAGATCQDWTIAQPSAQASTGLIATVKRVDWLGAGLGPCNMSIALRCLQL